MGLNFDGHKFFSLISTKVLKPVISLSPSTTILSTQVQYTTGVGCHLYCEALQRLSSHDFALPDSAKPGPRLCQKNHCDHGHQQLPWNTGHPQRWTPRHQNGQSKAQKRSQSGCNFYQLLFSRIYI
jgi:hypothetical protein